MVVRSIGDQSGERHLIDARMGLDGQRGVLHRREVEAGFLDLGQEHRDRDLLEPARQMAGHVVVVSHRILPARDEAIPVLAFDKYTDHQYTELNIQKVTREVFMQFHLNGFEPGDPEIADPPSGSPPRKSRRGPGRGRCSHRRLRPGRPDARGAASRLSRHQDLHRRAEAGPAAARPGRRRRLPHHGDVRGLWLQRARAEGGLLGQRDDVLEAGRHAAGEHRSQRPGAGRRGRAVGISARHSQPGAGA